MTYNPSLSRFNKIADDIRKDFLSVETKVTITEDIFIELLLPIFTRMANDEKNIDLRVWHSVAENPYNEIDVMTTDGSELLFTVPPILLRFQHNEEAQNKYMEVISVTDPEISQNTAGMMVGMDVRRESIIEKAIPTEFVNQNRSYDINMAFGLALFYRYKLPWFTDPETGKRYSVDDINVETISTGEVDAPKSEPEFSFEGMEEL